ncbi:MAG TPA: hypothetical protein VNZ22_16390, partial [Bacillota bacterium]|nr:hypothetical protein [Bacillota bacterium]
KVKATEFWKQAAGTLPPPERRAPKERLSERQVQTYFQALAQRKLGQNAAAETTLRGLLEAATQALNGEPAPASKRSTPQARLALAHYVAGLAHLGLGDQEKAKAEFALALQAAPDTLGPKAELARLR